MSNTAPNASTKTTWEQLTQAEQDRLGDAYTQAFIYPADHADRVLLDALESAGMLTLDHLQYAITPYGECVYSGAIATCNTGAAATDEAAELRDQVAALTAEVNELSYAVTSARAENERLNGLLNHAYDTRYEAVQRIAPLENHIRDLTAALEEARYTFDFFGRSYNFISEVADHATRAGNKITAALTAPVAAQPAPATTPAVRMDSYGAFTSSVGATCPVCGEDAETCDLCDGTGYYTVPMCGEWEERDCPACDGTGARRDTALYAARQAKRAADLEAARNAPIPF